MRRPPFGVKTVKLMPFGAERVGEHLHERNGRRIRAVLCTPPRLRRAFVAAGRRVLAAVLDGRAKTFSQLGSFDSDGLARHGWYVHSTHNKWLTTRCCSVARIAAGEFVMGADEGEEDERPLHRGLRRRVCDWRLSGDQRRVRAVRARDRSSLSGRSRAPAHGIWCSSNPISVRWRPRTSGTTARRPKDAIVIR